MSTSDADDDTLLPHLRANSEQGTLAAAPSTVAHTHPQATTNPPARFLLAACSHTQFIESLRTEPNPDDVLLLSLSERCIEGRSEPETAHSLTQGVRYVQLRAGRRIWPSVPKHSMGGGLESVQELKRLGRSRYLPLLDEFLDSTPLPPELPYPPNQTATYPLTPGG